MTEPNADSILSIFKQFWPYLDLLENELINTLEAKIEYPKEEHEPNMSISFYLDTINYTIREESEASGVFELRALFSNNSIKIISSSIAGNNTHTYQSDFGIYSLNFETGRFLKDSIDKELFKVQLKDYFKENAPDSVVNKIDTHTSYFFSLTNNEKVVAENQLFEELIGEKLKDYKWLKGDKIDFEYKNNKFTRSEPYFSEE